jgi:hypothetical protein
MSDIRALALKYYATVDAGDPEATTALFAADATYDRPGYDTFAGPAIGEFYRGDRIIVSGAHTVTEVVVDGNRAATRGEFNGKAQGRLGRPRGLRGLLRVRRRRPHRQAHHVLLPRRGLSPLGLRVRLGRPARAAPPRGRAPGPAPRSPGCSPDPAITSAAVASGASRTATSRAAAISSRPRARAATSAPPDESATRFRCRGDQQGAGRGPPARYRPAPVALAPARSGPHSKTTSAPITASSSPAAGCTRPASMTAAACRIPCATPSMSGVGSNSRTCSPAAAQIRAHSRPIPATPMTATARCEVMDPGYPDRWVKQPGPAARAVAELAP